MKNQVQFFELSDLCTVMSNAVSIGLQPCEDPSQHKVVITFSDNDNPYGAEYCATELFNELCALRNGNGYVKSSQTLLNYIS